MASIRVSEDYAAKADEVWRRLADFGGLDAWMPGVKQCALDGEGVGAVRTIEMGPVKIVERLEAFDAEGRSLSYSLLEGPMPLANFLATIRVSEPGTSGCRVDWSASFELPEGVGEEQVAPGIEAGYGGGLAALKQIVDG